MLEGSISYQIICFKECEISQLEIRKYNRAFLPVQIQSHVWLTCEAKAVIDNNFKFRNKERVQHFFYNRSVTH